MCVYYLQYITVCTVRRGGAQPQNTHTHTHADSITAIARRTRASVKMISTHARPVIFISNEKENCAALLYKSAALRSRCVYVARVLQFTFSTLHIIRTERHDTQTVAFVRQQHTRAATYAEPQQQHDGHSF